MRSLLSLLFLLPGFALAGRDPPHRPVNLPPPLLQPVAVDPYRLCETAVTTAEFIVRLPPRLLAAMSLTESGRIDPASDTLRSWPWTVNSEGNGQFFATKQEAIAAVMGLQAHGIRSIDIGCMQVNLMYHPDAFASLAEAFDPQSNVIYAARFLNSLYENRRRWSRAIAAYHSETPALGDVYRFLVQTHWQNPGRLDAERVPPAYRDFASVRHAYNAFAPQGRIYGAFAESLAYR